MKMQTMKMQAKRTLRSPITTHVLDVSLGKPASGIRIILEQKQGRSGFKEIAQGKTNLDGRVESLLKPGSFAKKGTYRLTFEVASYFRSKRAKSFYPTVSVTFEVSHPEQHHHVPLLLSPYGFSTYRGS